MTQYDSPYYLPGKSPNWLVGVRNAAFGCKISYHNKISHLCFSQNCKIVMFSGEKVEPKVRKSEREIKNLELFFFFFFIFFFGQKCFKIFFHSGRNHFFCPKVVFLFQRRKLFLWKRDFFSKGETDFFSKGENDFFCP